MFTSKIGGRCSPILTVAYFSKEWFETTLGFFSGKGGDVLSLEIPFSGSMGCLVYFSDPWM